MREQMAPTLADIARKLEDRSSQAELKDRLRTLEASLTRHDAQMADILRRRGQWPRTGSYTQEAYFAEKFLSHVQARK